jgi:hypothetical protein
MEKWAIMIRRIGCTAGLTSSVAALVLGLTGCGLFSNHQFIPPANDWKVRSGQLMYRTAQMKVVGDVIVRFSKRGDFELTFSKGPGVALFTIRQDATNAEVKSGLARVSWSGPVERAPDQLRGWLGLREKVINAPDQKVIRHTTETETFVFRF